VSFTDGAVGLFSRKATSAEKTAVVKHSPAARAAAACHEEKFSKRENKLTPLLMPAHTLQGVAAEGAASQTTHDGVEASAAVPSKASKWSRSPWGDQLTRSHSPRRPRAPGTLRSRAARAPWLLLGSCSSPSLRPKRPQQPPSLPPPAARRAHSGEAAPRQQTLLRKGFPLYRIYVYNSEQ